MIEHHLLNEVSISTYKVAKKGNWCSGDDYFIVRTDNYVLCAVADGLGSGEEAMEASSAAMEVIKLNHDMDTESLMGRCNDVLCGTRGIVLTIIKFDTQSKIMEYSNVGNISCAFYKAAGELYRPVPSRGYLCGKNKKIKTDRITYHEGMMFVIYSDGLIFDPLFHSFFSRNETPKTAINQVVDLMKDTNDDITILIGKINV